MKYIIKNGELYHYGILGMRWGRRKAKNPSSPDSDELKRIRKKNVDELSNQELTTANKRLELENKYKAYTKKTNKGKQVVKKIVATAGTITSLMGAYAVYKKVGDNVLNGIENLVIKDLNRGFRK